MRYGKNPTKFARHHSNLVKLDVKTAAPLTVTTVTYVPRLADYYLEGLDILRLTLSQIRATAPEPFDLMVFDNGSCSEVVDFLVELKEKGEIQALILSPYNMKKLGAINYLFSAAQGDFIYYFDSDILHFDGWYEEAMKIMTAFPKAGMVNAAPIPSQDKEVMEATFRIADRDPELQRVQGDVFDEEILRANAIAMGTNVEPYIQKAGERFQEVFLRDGVKALPIASHSHFLMRREAAKAVVPYARDWHLKHKDKHFDMLVSEAGYMRLGTMSVHVAHLGNVLTQRWRDYAQKKGVALSGDQLLSGAPRRGVRRFLLENRFTQKLLLRLHALTFRLLYNVR